MTLIFSYKSVHKSFGETPLFTDLSLNINQDHCLGLIGGNGSGKSTLLKLMADLDTPEEGDRYLKSLVKLVYLPQNNKLDPDKTISETLFESLAGENIEEQECYTIVKRMLGMGGFADASLKCSQLSGGWRKRVAITRALSLKPDLLLLDEPTNHLDIEGILWLENCLKNSDFAFVAVSHDRCFLENTCKRVMELGRCYPQGHLTINGGYIKFTKHRENYLEEQLKQESTLSNKMRREDQWLGQGAKARTTKARYRIDQAEVMRIELAKLRDRNRQTNRVDIKFSGSSRKTKKLLVCRNLGTTIQGKELFRDINLDLTPGICLGLMGENGSGKTTLMNILEGGMEPTTGEVKRVDNLRIAVFDQSRARLDQEQTLKQALSPAGDSVVYNGRSVHVASWAKKFLFSPDQLLQPVKWLSGGEIARIHIANLMLMPADVLLLDEPTNDLDIPSLEVLEQSLLEFPGAIVLVSHDRFLLDRVTNSILYLDGKGKAEIFADYNQVLSSQKSGNKPQKEKKQTPVKNRKKTSSSKLSFKDKFELEQIEGKILEAETELEELSSKTNLPEIISSPVDFSDICTRLGLAQEKVEKLYSRWEELEALKEACNINK